MAVKIIGIQRSTGQPFQITNATKSNLGNPIGQTDSTYTSYAYMGRRIIFFPDIANGRMKCFAYLNSAATTCYIRQSYEWLQTLTHGTVTNGPWVVGDGVLGGSSGATGTVKEVVDSTHIVVEVTNSTAFQAEAVTGTGTGSGKSCTVSAVTGTDICDAWINATSFSVFTAAVAPTDYQGGGGFHPYFDGANLYLSYLHAYNGGSTLYHRLRYDPTSDSWSNLGYATGAVTYNPAPTTLVYKNTLYMMHSTGKVFAVDLASGAGSVIGSLYSVSSSTSWGLCIHDGRVFVIAPEGFGYHSLYEVTGGSLTKRWTIYYGTPKGTIYGAGGWTAEDGSMMIGFGHNGGTSVYSVNTSTWSVTDQTSNLPSGYSALTYTKPHVYTDFSTNGPTGTPVTLVHFARQQPNGSVSIARCLSPTSWTDLGSFAGANDYFLGDSLIGEGEFVYESGANYGVLSGGLTKKVGGQQFSFRIYGSGSCNFEYLVEKDAFTGENMSRATLSSPSSGSLTDGNKKITGLTANGSEVTATWASETDGATPGDFYERRPFISV